MRLRLLAPLALLILTGCGPGWQRTEPTPGAAIDPETQHLVFGGDSTVRWHALRVSGDSVSGIPWLTPVTCDSCRRSRPLAGVDSIQVGHPEKGFWKGVGVVYLAPLLVFAVLCRFQPCGFGGD